MRQPGFETLCAHAGEEPARFLGAPVPPIFQNSLFTSPDAESFIDRAHRRPEVYDYTRVANPTTDILEAKLAALEGTEAARCFGSGMAAVLYFDFDYDAVLVPHFGDYSLGALYLPVVVITFVVAVSGGVITDGMDGLMAGVSALRLPAGKAV